ncbi:MAG: hypothetical protein ACK5IC_08665 [Moheibacter sp.]
MKKTIYFLLVCLTGIFFYCSEDDTGNQQNETSTKSHLITTKKITIDQTPN